MNQSVQVLDGFTYQTSQNVLVLEAIAAGQLIRCFVEDISVVDIDSFYSEHQFDLEEKIIDLIDEEDWNEKGEVWFSANEL